MINRYRAAIFLSVASVLFFSVFFQGVIIQAISGTANIQYPVEELGSCQSESDCKNYCDQPNNREQCLDFASRHGLMSSQEIAVARKFLSGQIEGPGGCTDKETCEAYCSDISHINQCVDFADKNNLLPPEELQEFKQIRAAIEKGATPPACKNKQECELYCEDPSHMRECVSFGKEAGFLKGHELQEAEKMIKAIERGVNPPPCRGRAACEQYCSAPENMEMCMNFAIEAGFMSGQEKENAQKMLSAFKKGVKPLSCRGKEECDAYCSRDEHFDECFNFAEAAGFITGEEAQIARKTKGKGPGGCKGKEECEAFCQNPQNQETCFSFAKDNGIIGPEEIKHMEEGRQQMRQNFDRAPAPVLECLQGKVGPELVEKIKEGFMPSREHGQQIKECFEAMRADQGQNFEGQNREGMDQRPPSDRPKCQTPEECEKFKMMQQGQIPQDLLRQGPPPQDMQDRNMMPKEFSQEMMDRKNIQLPPGEFMPPPPPPNYNPENYQRLEESYPKPPDGSYQMPAESYQQPQPLPEPAPQTAPSDQPTGFLQNTILGALLYSLFDLVLGR